MVRSGVHRRQGNRKEPPRILPCAHRPCRAILLALALLLFACSAIAGQATPKLRLPAWAVPVSYRLHLRVDPARSSFSGQADIDVKLTRASDHLWINAQDLDIRKARITDAAGTTRPARQVRTMSARGLARIAFGRTLAPQRLTLHIAWRASCTGSFEGAYRITRDGRHYIVTDTQPLGARRVFPSFDDPAHKTPYTLSLTVPTTMVALANTPRTDVRTAGSGWKTVTFAPTRPLPTYLLAFAVGPWDLDAAPDLPPHGKRTRPVPLRAVSYHGRSADMRWVLAQTPGIVAGLEDYYASPYPWKKLDLLDVDGGMENPGLVALGNLGSGAPNASLRSRRGAFDLAAHELAHQWTGDLVTMAWWNDIWLNESMAIWMQQKLSLRLHPDYRADLQRIRDMHTIMAEDTRSGALPIRHAMHTDADIEGAFDGTNEGKGAAVLTMFEHYVGASTFRRGVRRYIHAHAFGSATGPDLVHAIAKASGGGPRLRAAFDSFLDQPGVPYVHARLQATDDGAVLHLRQSRYRPLGAPAARPLRWDIPVCVRYGARDHAERTRCTLMDSAAATLPLPGADADSWVMPNVDALGYYHFGMDRAGLATLARHAGALDQAEQLAYADAVNASFRHGDIDAGDVLAALKPLTAGGGEDLTASVLDQVGWIWRHEAATEAQRQRLATWVADAYLPRLRRLGYHHRAGEADADRSMRALLARTLALTYRIPAVRAALLAQGRVALGIGSGHPADLAAVDGDLLPAVLGVSVQSLGRPAEKVMIADLGATHDVARRHAIIHALGDADDPALARDIRDLALDPRFIGGESLMLAMGQRDSRARRDAMWQWFEHHPDAMFQRLGDRSWVLPRLLGVDGCSREDSDRMQRFFGPRAATHAGLARSLAQTRSAIDQCAALRRAQDPASILR